MVDMAAPDFENHPRFKQALANAQVADMQAGDVLFYPAMWWHQVEALENFNVLVNYWWNTTPKYMDSPQTTLLHALLSLRDRPEQEKRAWRALFEYYVFGDPKVPADHVPAQLQGNLASMDERKARKLRAEIINRLNR